MARKLSSEQQPFEVVIRAPGQAVKSRSFASEKEAREYFKAARAGLSRYGTVELWTREASGGSPVDWYPKRGRTKP